jgi:hypothetical protein
VILDGRRAVSEQPMITFAVHQVRAGQAGASEDFEQMLGLLVRATSGREASLVFANPGDWGIDVLAGDLHGQVTVWQAKYFARGVGRSQQAQIRSSFASAVRAAAGHGYALERWVLCIPASMDGPTTQWWHAWKAEQERVSGVLIGLWDETRLRELLLRPEAADVYRHYYAPYLHRAVGTPRAADPDTSFRARVDRAAEELAAAVSDQWGREEKLRRIQDPIPLPMRWAAADPLLSDHVANIHRIPGEAIDLDGTLNEAVDIFTRIPSRRLVVVGQAGAGKTVFTLRFTLDLLARRQPGDPVPVIFGLHTWNPLEQPLQEWMAARLAADYPALGNAGKPGRTIASELVGGDRILPVLDGLDEVSQPLRGDALRTLNMSLGKGAPVIVTCRESDYQQVVAEADVLTSAAVIELLPLQLSDLAGYLPRTARKIPAAMPGGSTTKWDPVLQRMGTDPGDPACRMLLDVLSTPLMTSLARSAYSDTAADPAVLLDSKWTDRREIESHLLDGFIPAAFAGPVTIGPRRGRPGPRAQDAERWLSFLARHLDRLGTQDLEWWRLQDAVPPPIRWLAPGLVVWLSVGTTFEIMHSNQGWAEKAAVAACAAIGLMLGLALINFKPSAITQDRTAGRLRFTLRRLCYTGAAAVPAGLFFGFCYNMSPGGPYPGGGRAQIIALAFSLLGSLAVGVVLGAAGIDVQQAPMITPLHLHRKFRTLSRRLFYGIGHGLLNGFLVALVLWVTLNLAFSGAAELRIPDTPTFPPGSIGQPNSSHFPAIIEYVTSLLAMVIIILPVGLIGGFFLWLSFPADVAQAINPPSTLRTDRNAAIFRSVIISLLILLTIVIGTLSIAPHVSKPEFERIAEVAMLLSMATGLLTITLSTWLRLQVARIWLSARGQLPWNVMRFLEEAHARNALRQVGAAYQFRHARLQEQLVARAKITHPRRSSRVSDEKRDDLAHSGRGT